MKAGGKGEVGRDVERTTLLMRGGDVVENECFEEVLCEMTIIAPRD